MKLIRTILTIYYLVNHPPQSSGLYWMACVVAQNRATVLGHKATIEFFAYIIPYAKITHKAKTTPVQEISDGEVVTNGRRRASRIRKVQTDNDMNGEDSGVTSHDTHLLAEGQNKPRRRSIRRSSNRAI